ncbi:MAG: patatin-like phospholipase family protein [Burkholderiaceae bacterium]|nr:patatin-like phospholipase family protein [Burkholderiaceae bacterium]
MTATITPLSRVRAQRVQPSAKPRIGLVLAGGGPLGAVYEIGALAAIEESIEGLDVNDASVYVGISAGGIIASGLANGITPHEMCRLFIESDTEHDGGVQFKPELLLRPAWTELRKRAQSVPGLLAGSLLHFARGRGKRTLADSFERMKRALPTGILSGDGIHEFLQHTFSQPGRTNDFRQLRHKLVLVATDVDSGEAICYGQPGLDDVPISRAAQGSAAVPGLFPPVEINGRHVVDGVLRKTLHASIALEHGVDLAICINPIVPYNARVAHGAGKIADDGLLTVLSQTLRSIIHSRVKRGMDSYQRSYPESDILLFEPNEEDAEMFFTNLFSTSNRRRMCENAYQDTRIALWRNRVAIDRKLARHGLHLKLPVLQDSSLTLVQNPPRNKKDRFKTDKLGQVLDQLEHTLKVAGG